MEKIKHLFILNPFAGKGMAVTYGKKIKDLFEEITKKYPDTEYEIVETKYPHHATEISKEYSSKDKYRIYSVGGDGTLNEVLNGMAGSDSSLACIPCGTGNDFIKTIAGSDFKRESLLRETILGDSRPIDVGSLNGRYFTNILSIGFDSRVNVETQKWKKKAFVTSKMAFFFGIIGSLKYIKPFCSEITMNGKTTQEELFMVSICNGTIYGAEYKIAPMADIEDGYMDIIKVDMVGIRKIMKYLPLIKKGEHLTVPEIHHEKTKEVLIKSNVKFILNLDGEITETDEADIKLHHKFINFVFPKGVSIEEI